MNKFSDFDLDLQNIKTNIKNKDELLFLTNLIECIIGYTVTCSCVSCQDYSCAGCHGVSVTDLECGCPPKDLGTLGVCVNNINNTF